MKVLPSKLSALAAVVLSLSVTSALALPAVALPAGNIQLSDDSAEYLIKDAGNSNPLNVGTIEVNDRLRGIFEINKVQRTPDPSFALGAAATNELTGIFEITVTSKIGFGSPTSFGGTCLSAFCYTFGTSASFATEMGLLGFGSTSGAMVALFEDINGNDFNRASGTIATMEANATDGNPFWLAGLSLATDFWIATSDTDNLTTANFAAQGTPFGQFAMGLSLLDNPFGPGLNKVTCTNKLALPGSPFTATNQTSVCANGGLFAKGPVGDSGSVETAYDSLDDVNFNVNVIPEPSSIALLGLALLGLGVTSRRRKV